MDEPVLSEVGRLTCPGCGGVSVESVPDNACVHFFECPHCGDMLRPKPGDCCVFCSYSDRRCPPRRRE